MPKKTTTKSIRTPKPYLEITVHLGKKKKSKPKTPKLTKEQKKELREKEIYSSLIKNQARRINDSYRELEKANLEKRSMSYRTVEHYAVTDPRGQGKMYNINLKKGTLRVSADTRKMSLAEMKAYSSKLNQILHHKTRTVSGTKEAIKQSYETAKNLYQFNGTLQDYEKVWDTYSDVVEQEKKQRLDSETVMTIMEYTDIYKLSKEDLTEALRYIRNGSTKDDVQERISDIQEALEIMTTNPPEEAAELFETYGYTEFINLFPGQFGRLREFI